jgi:hypothetical protein
MSKAKSNSIRITSVAEFLQQLTTLKLSENCLRFFRGHSDFKRYQIRPSIYRHTRLIANESNLIEEAIIRCPADFPDSCTWFEKLVRLQHYGLPTRLLDVTTNALAAMYFACREKERTDGEVIVFDIPKPHIKYYNSDTVSVIANLARRPYTFDRKQLPVDEYKFNDHPEIGRLLHDIREDKPAFRPLIVCVRAKLDKLLSRMGHSYYSVSAINSKSRSKNANLLNGVLQMKGRPCVQVCARGSAHEHGDGREGRGDQDCRAERSERRPLASSDRSLSDRHRKDAEQSAIRHTIGRQSRSAPHAGRLRGGAEWPPSW